jgi:hypothetical protein
MPYISANECSQRAIKRRQEARENSGTNGLFWLPNFDDDINIFLQTLAPFREETAYNISSVLDTTLLLLHQCIFSIIWEFIDCPKTQSILNVNCSMLQNFALLRSAAAYQAKHDNVSESSC